MLEQFKLDMKLHWDNLLERSLFALFGMVLGLVMGIFVIGMNQESSYICCGAMMALGMFGLCSFLWYMSFSNELSLAVSMGRTRKAFLLSYALRSILSNLLAYALVLLGYQLEKVVYPMMFPGCENGLPIWHILTNGWVIALAVPGMTLLQMFFGGLYGKFGKPFQTIAYFVFLGCCVLLPQLLHRESAAGRLAWKLFSWGKELPETVWLGLLACGVATLVAATVRMARKQMVK